MEEKNNKNPIIESIARGGGGGALLGLIPFLILMALGAIRRAFDIVIGNGPFMDADGKPLSFWGMVQNRVTDIRNT